MSFDFKNALYHLRAYCPIRFEHFIYPWDKTLSFQLRSPFRNEDQIYNAIVWFLSFLLICTGSTIVLYNAPYFPVAVLFVNIIEIFIFVKIFQYSKRINESIKIKDDVFLVLPDIEGRVNSKRSQD